METLDASKPFGYLQRVPKVWGIEVWMVNNELYCAKKLTLLPGRSSSLHYHRRKDETFHVMSGSCFLELNGRTLKLTIRQSIRIRPGDRHRFYIPKGAGTCVILEVSTHHSDDDVVRLEPSKLL